MSFLIEREFRSLVIGTNGENILALWNDHNVSINIEEDGEVVVRGEEEEAAN